MNNKIERERWSEASKRSFAYLSKAVDYEDIHYNCAKCDAAAVFTAEEQKKSFENKKKYIWQRRKLCPTCNAELFHLKQRERAFQARWSSERNLLASDPVFIREWLAILQTIPQYSPIYENSMIRRLTGLLQRADAPKS